MIELIEKNLKDASDLMSSTLTEKGAIAKATQIIIDAFRNGNKLLVAGNGGSAADAQHMTGELVCTFYNRNRKGLPAICLHGDTSALTAWANDFSYDSFFARGVEAYGARGDIFFAITTSGNSKNLINAALKAKEMGMKTISLLGKGGGKMKGMCDAEIIVPHDDTARIQEAHHVIYHTICQIVEKELFPNV
jgi:D-sedoheptulose 7-phosphate isomerase